MTDFYQSIADETLDVNEIIDKYLEQQRRESDTHDDITYRSAEGYNLQQTQNDEITRSKEDVLVIDQDLKDWTDAAAVDLWRLCFRFC